MPPIRLTILCLLLSAPLSCVAGAAQANTSNQEHERLAQQYLHQNRPDLAIPEFEAIVHAEPENVDAQANLGVLLYFHGAFSQAEPHLRAAVTAAPNIPKLQALLGMCERQLRENDLARKDLAASVPNLKDERVQRQAGLQLIELDTAAGDLPAAADVANLLKQQFPADPTVLYAAYRTYTDLAGESLLDLSIAAPESAQMHQAMAHELVRERDTDAAVANFRKAIAIDPGLPGIHFELAEALRTAQDERTRALAQAEYELALKQNPDDEKSMVRLADIATDQNNLQHAEQLDRKALELQPDDADAEIGLARILLEENQPAEAAKLLEKVIAADPTNTLAHYRLSAVYRRMHRTQDAQQQIAEYKKYRDLKEKLRSIYEQLRMPQRDQVPQNEPSIR